MSIERLNPEQGDENKDRLELELNGCDVAVEDNNIITGPDKDDSRARLLREVINSPKLIVRKEGRPFVIGDDFRAWRKEILENPKFLNDPKYEKVVLALKQNNLSMTRIAQIGEIIDMLSDNPQSADWKRRYKEIEGSLTGPMFSVLSEEFKNKLSKKFEDLAIEIYNSL